MPRRRARWRRARCPLPLTAAEAADLRALATGAYSPLTGFMGAKEHESVTESMRLPDGTSGRSRCLGIPDGVRVDGRLTAGRGGELLGVLEVTEVFERDRAAEAELVYGTSDPEHPAVAGAPSAGRWPAPSSRGRPLAGPGGHRP